ncbi:hypothetical protein BDW02DRAFT_590383 [Decorospora gaudefroyi]|uniref:Uncharacterized protein n=1 Tax=Decorospora gaudefroyi TaxID=184978 RepID=A0A6A5KC25_9PLEO|nr:hypothetical protein BDW02DRAFT_590383 [Decorospora gaudefroyi]
MPPNSNSDATNKLKALLGISTPSELSSPLSLPSRRGSTPLDPCARPFTPLTASGAETYVLPVGNGYGFVGGFEAHMDEQARRDYYSKWATQSDEADKAAAAETPAPVQATYDPPVTMSYDPAFDDPSIDPFAQTASTDDLFFDDDITPIAEPVVEHSPLELQASAAEFLPEDLHPPTAPQAHLTLHAPREPRNTERGGRGRGRGRGGRARGRGGHNTDVRLEQNDRKTPEAAKEPESKPAAHDTSAERAEFSSTPTEPKEKPTHSVRGDRTLTGGAARTRLTEEELNAKLANMRIKSEARQSAHARAEADKGSFEAREAVMQKQDVERKKALAEKQKAERQSRQQMMGEREKNRQRKLNAQQGREWDFEKEDGFSGTGEERRRGATRGAHGGIAPARTVDSGFAGDDTQEPTTQSYRGRGRGRGGRGVRGGRGDFDGSGPRPAEQKKHQDVPPSASDFPELPSAKGKTAELKQNEPDRPAIQKQDSFGLPSPMEKGRSWADEVGS